MYSASLSHVPTGSVATVTDVERLVRHSTPRPTQGLGRWSAIASLVATVLVGIFPTPALASLSSARAQASTLYKQIQSIDGRVGYLGQKYDMTLIKLHNITHVITNTKSIVSQIQRDVTKGNAQLRADAIFAYVTNGSAASNNPMFSSNATTIGETNVYNQVASGNVSTTIANLKDYRIKLTQERSILAAEDRQAANAARTAASALHEAKLLQATLQNTLSQVKGQIATFISQEEAAAAAQSASTLQNAQPIAGFPAPPPDSRANIAIRAALSFLGVPYVWGGASRSGVDCSGLVMLAYAAAGIFLPHYSGAQFADTMRVPLIDLQPGDLLFYGYEGDQHVAMYLGNGEMIEAPSAGYTVHITPVRLGYGFAGAGRPRA